MARKKSKRINVADVPEFDFKLAAAGGYLEDPPEREFPREEKKSIGITVVECKVPIEKTMGLNFFPKPRNNPPADAQKKLC